MIVERVPWCDPAEAAAKLRPLGGLAFLDSATPNAALGRYSYVAADPFGSFTVSGGRAFWNGAPLDAPPVEALKTLLAAFAVDRRSGLPPFQGGAIGTLDYEFGGDLHDLPAPANPAGDAAPSVRLLFYDAVIAFDHEAEQAWIISTGWPETGAAGREARAHDRLALLQSRLDIAEPPAGHAGAIVRSRWQSNFSRETYMAAAAAVIEAIRDGEIFQANIAQRFETRIGPSFDPFVFYRRLRRTNPAPFAAFLDQGTRVIASSSPELFVTLLGDRMETRPIKGTARRSPDPGEDRVIAARLAASEKDRAENTMIVDLLRNDLSRVGQPHSIDVPALCALESYAEVHHLVSCVTGTLATTLTAVDLLAACFPGGSVTGAPKAQAMRVIARVERQRRGVYCGTVVGLGFNGTLTSNIAIRTVSFEDGRAVFQAGGGVTILSDPASEYQETLDKAERIFAAFAASDADA